MIAILTNTLKKEHKKRSFKFTAIYRGGVVCFRPDYTWNQSSMIPPFPQVFYLRNSDEGFLHPIRSRTRQFMLYHSLPYADNLRWTMSRQPPYSGSHQLTQLLSWDLHGQLTQYMHRLYIRAWTSDRVLDWSVYIKALAAHTKSQQKSYSSRCPSYKIPTVHALPIVINWNWSFPNINQALNCCPHWHFRMS